tara:strand:+ start:934 stop:1113 length:180 start_codon:yes stop_codon:yes gene_type:complete
VVFLKHTNTEEQLKEFFSHFYEICTSSDAFNYTLDEFYDDFSEETHNMLSEFSKLAKRE